MMKMFPRREKGKVFPAWHCSLVMASGTKFSLAVFLEVRKDKRFPWHCSLEVSSRIKCSLEVFPGVEQCNEVLPDNVPWR
jgi:hypothetical protein